MIAKPTRSWSLLWVDVVLCWGVRVYKEGRMFHPSMTSPSLLPRFLLALVVFTALGLAAPNAKAVGTRTFVLDTMEELSGGDLKGVAVGSDGVVRAGFTLGSVAVPDATAVWSALTLADGTVLLGTSPNGAVMKVSGDQVSVFAETKELAVTALAEDAKGTVFAATMPDGKIYKVSQGKAEAFVTLPDTTHVWALAFDKTKTVLFAATGPEGKVFRVDASGAAAIYFKSDEPHLVSLAVGPNGEIYAGSSGKALLYKIAAPGRATVLYDFPGEEVRSIAVSPNGPVFAISNEYGEQPEVPRRTGGTRPASAATTARPKPGKGTLTRIDAQGRPEKLMHHDEFHYMSLAVDGAGHPYVGTGAEGRVYTVDDTHAITLVADTDERAIGAIGLGGLPQNTVRAFFASSDACNFHRVMSRGGADAVWTSKSFDTGLPAKYGTLSWRATGGLEMSMRTGNTDKPDATWTTWSNPLAAPGGTNVADGRYVQVRARWSRDPNAELVEVSIPFVTENVRAVVTSVDASMKGSARDSKEGLVASGGENPKHDSIVKVTWHVDNPDLDAMRFRLAYRREEQKAWRDMNRTDEIVVSPKAEYDWETSALPEGKYRVRVEASDEISNPPERAQKDSLESQTVLVDNTPPTFTALTINGRKLKARVVDVVGPIARVEVAVDGRLEWRPIAPQDGLYDSADESFDADVSSIVPAGSHIVAVRASDSAGNTVVREIESN